VVDAKEIATALCEIRMAMQCRNRCLSLNQMEALLWIAAGVDRLADLKQVMRMDHKSLSRLVSTLRCRPRLAEGRLLTGPMLLVEVRKHPHKRGQQLMLSEKAQELLSATVKISSNNAKVSEST